MNEDYIKFLELAMRSEYGICLEAEFPHSVVQTFDGLIAKFPKYREISAGISPSVSSQVWLRKNKK